MYLTVKQQLKRLNKRDYRTLRELTHIAKNLANEAIYNVRQYYFAEKKYLNYEKNYHILKTSNNYKKLNSNMAQQILKEVDGSFESFFGLLKIAKKEGYNSKFVKLPNYLEKDGHTTLIVGMIRINNGNLIIPFSNSFSKTHERIKIKIPNILEDKTIKEIRIIPKNKARYFEIQYAYKVEKIQNKLDKTKALGIDLGINNLLTCVTSYGESFIIDGRKIKSYNKWYNKKNAKLQSIKDKQKIKGFTNRQYKLLAKRNNRINDYISKSAKRIINYCLDKHIGNIVIGYNVTFQKNVNLSKKTKQHFLSIPYDKIREKIKYLCELNGINFIEQEESYTSKASFFDGDKIQKYNDDNSRKYKFSGRRINRGLYQTSKGKLINADCNGALNILKKSKVVDLEVLYCRGELNTPVRIRVA